MNNLHKIFLGVICILISVNIQASIPDLVKTLNQDFKDLDYSDVNFDPKDPTLATQLEEMIRSWTKVDETTNLSPMETYGAKKMIQNAKALQQALINAGSVVGPIAAEPEVLWYKGSYEASCKDCRFLNNKIEFTCKCKNYSGQYVPSSIFTNQCKSTLSNKMGVLTCDPYIAPVVKKGPVIFKKPSDLDVRKKCVMEKGCHTITPRPAVCDTLCPTLTSESDKECPAICDDNDAIYCPSASALFGKSVCGCFYGQCPTDIKPNPQAKGCFDFTYYGNKDISILNQECPAVCLKQNLQYCPDKTCASAGKCGCFAPGQGCPPTPDLSPEFVGCVPRTVDAQGKVVWDGKECSAQGLLACPHTDEDKKCGCEKFDPDGDCLVTKNSIGCFRYACPATKPEQPITAKEALKLYAQLKFDPQMNYPATILDNLKRLQNSSTATAQEKAQAAELFAQKSEELLGARAGQAAPPTAPLDALKLFQNVLHEISNYTSQLAQLPIDKRANKLVELQAITSDQLGIPLIKNQIDNLISVGPKLLTEDILPKDSLKQLMELMQNLSTALNVLTLSQEDKAAIKADPKFSLKPNIQNALTSFIQFSDPAKPAKERLAVQMEDIFKALIKKHTPLRSPQECLNLLI